MKTKNYLIKICTFVLIFFILFRAVYAANEPTGATIVFNETETKTPAAATFVNTTGGSFTTLVLFAETQNPRWKAYVGNITGILTLDDASDYTIYNWQLSSTSGQVYASRNNSITWEDIQCADQTEISDEETVMNHTTANEDSINSTFEYQIHREFYVGAVHLSADSCRSTATWVNDSSQTISQNALFQEVLLSDTSSFIYATLLENSKQGFNFEQHDFQMIVAEKDLQGEQSTPYYFWVELV
ncbi:hypothetical protein JXB41_02580 [Candidatus Woesearchaeota archaeon]|nr:hypothetical protein [Candidatus Woesearchaeota archaeon]